MGDFTVLCSYQSFAFVLYGCYICHVDHPPWDGESSAAESESARLPANESKDHNSGNHSQQASNVANRHGQWLRAKIS